MNNINKYCFLICLITLWSLAHSDNVVYSGGASATLSDAVTIYPWFLHAAILVLFGYHIMKPKRWVDRTAKVLSVLFLIKVSYCLILVLFTSELLMEAMMAGNAVEASEIERNWVNIGWIGLFYFGSLLGLFIIEIAPPTEDALKARSASKA